MAIDVVVYIFVGCLYTFVYIQGEARLQGR
jgi:hypothetical protein